MTSPPDKRFRDHLESYQRSAPSSAWDRIEAAQQRRSARRLWLRMAAGFTLLLAVSLVLWTKDDDSWPGIDLATPAHPSDKKSDEVRPSPFITESRLDTETTIKSATGKIAVHPTSINTVRTPPRQPASGAVTIQISDEKGMESEKEVVATLSPKEELQNIESAITVSKGIGTEPTEKQSYPVHTTLVYTSQDVHDRFLKKSDLAEATSAPKNTSGLKKVIDIVAGIKYDDGVYGDLRDKKNEFLSLSFLDSKHAADK